MSKLKNTVKSSKLTVLLVENSDIALMDNRMLRNVTREAYPDGLPQGVDQTWFADTSVPEVAQFHDFTSRVAQKGEELTLGP